MRRVALALALAPLGCLPSAPTFDAQTEGEALVISETARFAGMLGVRVHGELVDQTRLYPPGQYGCPADAKASCYATGWLEGGVAWYYRRGIAEAWEIGGAGLVSGIAAHEVAHALHLGHDAAHYCEIVRLGAVPTYPPPVAGLVCR